MGNADDYRAASAAILRALSNRSGFGVIDAIDDDVFEDILDEMTDVLTLFLSPGTSHDEALAIHKKQLEGIG